MSVLPATLFAEAQVASNYADGFSLMVLFTRVALGVALFAHGFNKFFGGGRIPGTARWFDSMGMKPGRVHAVLAATTETVSGVLFALGLLTPLAAAGFVGVMTVAGWTVHRPNGFFSAKDGWELNFVMALAAVTVAVVSPGEYSVDWLIGLDVSFDPRAAFVLSAVLGLAGGAGQLIAFYRPPSTDS